MQVTRRQLLIGSGVAVASGAISIPFLFWANHQSTESTPVTRFQSPDSIPVSKRPKELAYLAPYINKPAKWGPGQLFQFLNQLSSKHIASLGKSLEIDHFESMKKSAKVREIHRSILWQSSNVFTYPFKSLEQINYHDLVVWCAGQVGLPSNEARFTSTFALERQIVESQFVTLWDKLNEKQRKKLLEKIDSSDQIENKIAISAMSGAAAFAALSTTVYFAGFAFYTTMSVVICTVAGFFGVTLPFMAYMTASSTIAVLTGPIGWAIAAVVVAGTIALWAGKADVRKTTATVMQIHCMKAGALYGNGESCTV